VYLKVDFKNTKITTVGLNLKGYVEFKINMPFVRVNKCDAFTGIVHCGTWVNQKNKTLNIRLKDQLIKLKRIKVGIIDRGYFSTDEGYKEYWVQFKHYKYQFNCKKN
jgi:fumarate reductase subunit C